MRYVDPMGFLTDLLLGKQEQEQLSFTDARIGVLTTTVRWRRGRKPDVSEWRVWSGQHLLAGHRVPTRFQLSGDGQGPVRDLVVHIHRVMDDLARIAEKANRALSSRGAAGSFGDFDLVSVGDWDQVDEILQLDLVPRGASVLDADLTIYWPGDDELADHHVVLRAG